MNSVKRATISIAACVPLLPFCGCLSLGGKTTYVQETPETQNRLSAIEARVSGLEHAVYQSTAPAGAVIESR